MASARRRPLRRRPPARSGCLRTSTSRAAIRSYRAAPTAATRPRAIKNPNRWPVLRTRAKRGAVEPGRWVLNRTKGAKTNRRAGGATCARG